METGKTTEKKANAGGNSKWWAFLLAVLAFIAVYWAWPQAEPNQAVVAATLVAVVILWVSEVIALFVSALIGSFLLLAFGDFTAEAVFQPYFDPVIVLFFGGFILAQGMQKYGIDYRIAHEILKRMGDRPLVFVLGLMLVTAFLSMWMSNTASAAIMIPISIIVLKENRLFHEHSRFAKGVVLAVAYAATIGGIGSLVGSPPNAIAVKFLNQNNVSLDFVEWMAKALPFVLLALLFTWLLLSLFNKPEIDRIRFTYHERKLDRSQKLIILVFLITVIGWLSTKFTGLSAATVALVPVIALFTLGLLEVGDLAKISWPTLLLFGGGLSLGSAVNQVGIDTWLAGLVQDSITGIPLFAVLLILVFFGIGVTMVASNTASAAILIPLMLPLADDLGLDIKSMAMLIAIGVSLDFMMPVGTPPSAIAYSTGVVNVREMIKNGFLVNLGTGMTLVLLYYFIYLGG
ncbi:MAG: DASS family sodium-coupled anion symporter [Gammaproteobacteria bacterium]|nr:DASS family sodium-coupled anion symporter [Gammaproteobacteria bacterium]MDH3857583.1 DASS family sodium-coupled anion symporter [Gammaproteobacteria bacterium]